MAERKKFTRYSITKILPSSQYEKSSQNIIKIKRVRKFNASYEK